MKQAMNEVKRFCGQCGAAARPQARFCGECGFDMAAMPQAAVQIMASEAPPSYPESGEAAGGSLGLGKAWMIYLGAALLCMGSLRMASGTVTGWVTVLIYLASSLVMTRYVMRNLIEFHPVHNTVGNVFSAKIWMFLLWPFHMLVLLFKLTVNRLL
ncbi:zinc ribbon domain-containing protein [Polaromonas jejuensis]|uniref:Zinc-ribbon domain-containing protein n=1 Tax=Polaromonas jejuensis TaxID=457502 RepID=A0ABW0QEL5_9BURK|nr:zinc ribbon domain-containing protein [Polaromonas jejuensis]